MADERRDEKNEEKREKPDEKQEEKGRGEKWRRDPVSAVVWAGILIWAGIVLLLDGLGLLRAVPGLQAWSLIFIGAGVIVLLEAAFRTLVPAYRRPVAGTVIFGVILIAIGLGNLLGWAIVGPLALVLIGLYLLLRGLVFRR